LTRRFKTWVENAIPDDIMEQIRVINYSRQYGMTHIKFYFKNDPEHWCQFLLAYDSGDGRINLEGYINHNEWAALEEGRLKILEGLSYDRVQYLAEQWNTTLRNLKNIASEASQYGYPMSARFDIRKR
jgi:hypothetical protein